MSAATTTTASVAITERYFDGFVEGVFRNDGLLRLFRAFGMEEQNGSAVYDTGIKWHLNSAGNTSVGTTSEGDAAPAAGNQSWVRATLSWVYHWGFVRITKQLEDAIKDGGHFPADLDSEILLCQRDIQDSRTGTFLGSGANGIQTMISDTATYAGITRGSAAYFESITDTTSAAQTIARHKSVHRQMRDADKAGQLVLNMTSPTQADTYSDLVGSDTTVNKPQVSALLKSMGGAGAFDVGVAVNGQTFSNAPIIEMRDLDTALWLYLDMTPAAGWFHHVVHDFTAEWHQNVGASAKYMLLTGSAFGTKNPKLSAKRSGLT